MSKVALKKELLKLTKEQLIEQILDLYDKNKAIREQYDLFLNPKYEKNLTEKYKKAIRREFNVENPMSAGLKFSVAKRAITDFKSLQPSPGALADVMLTLPERACEFTANYGDMSEQFYTATVNNFVAVLKFISKNGLQALYQSRVKQCVKWASPCGYGFADEMDEVYQEYYSQGL